MIPRGRAVRVQKTEHSGLALRDLTQEIARGMPSMRDRRFAQWKGRKVAAAMRNDRGRAIGNFGRFSRNEDLSWNFVRNRLSELFHILKSNVFISIPAGFWIPGRSKSTKISLNFRIENYQRDNLFEFVSKLKIFVQPKI